jgi:hypothetical protein
MARELAGTRFDPVEAAKVNPASAKVNPSRPIGRPMSLVPQRLVPHRLTAAERHRRICDLAYRRAEQRGFAPGGEVDDWLEAEREVDAGRY